MMEINSKLLVKILQEEGVNTYVAIAKYMRLYAQSEGLPEKFIVHMAHLGFLMYTVGATITEEKEDETKEK